MNGLENIHSLQNRTVVNNYERAKREGFTEKANQIREANQDLTKEFNAVDLLFT